MFVLGGNIGDKVGMFVIDCGDVFGFCWVFSVFV